MIHLAIAEDNSFALKAVLDKLGTSPEIKVRLIANNGSELLKKINSVTVDAVLMDIEMPEMNGIETTNLLKERNPKIKVIAFTTFDDDDKILDMIRAGASSYLLKDEPADKLVAALQSTMEGGASMSPSIAFKVINLLKNPQAGAEGERKDFGLTTREIEVLQQLKSGLTYDAIADNLFISQGTVRKHIENIYRKMSVDNKVGAINMAVRYRVV